MRKAKHFDLEELVCRHLHEAYGDGAWRYMRDELIDLIDWMRDELDRPIYVNTWKWHDNGSTQRGVRCNLCQLVVTKVDQNMVYLSPHMQGIGVDMTVSGMTTAEVHKWLEDHIDDLPVPIRIEKGVPHIHLDTRNEGTRMIEYCRP